MSVHHWLRLLAFPMRTSAFANGQTWDLPVPAQGASTHARFFDPAGAPSLAISCLTMLPSALETASAPGTIDFVAQWLAYALPYRRFAAVLANGNARLGADVVRYAFRLSQPRTFSDPLTEVLRNGARVLLAQAVEAEVAALLAGHADKLTDDGRQRLVRHGHLPEREIMTGIGAVAVRCPRVRDRAGEGGERIRCSSTILPPYARRSKSLEVLIPILYLKGISTGDFEEALIALLGKDAGGLSASTIGRLKEAWSDEHTRWSKRDLSAKRYVYFW